LSKAPALASAVRTAARTVRARLATNVSSRGGFVVTSSGGLSIWRTYPGLALLGFFLGVPSPGSPPPAFVLLLRQQGGGLFFCSLFPADVAVATTVPEVLTSPAPPKREGWT
jgi:hypothetical protein